MTSAINIPQRTTSSSPSHQVSISPTAASTFSERFLLARKDATSHGAVRQPKVLHPVDNDHLKLLVLENISLDAVKVFEGQGFKVDHHKKAMSEDELVACIGNYHAIGIRSKTRITERVIKAASKVCPLLCYL
jgi:D-3-phosphoglycerate dehydrogenase